MGLLWKDTKELFPCNMGDVNCDDKSAKTGQQRQPQDKSTVQRIHLYGDLRCVSLIQVDRAVSCYRKELRSEEGHAFPGEEEFRQVSETALLGEPDENRQGSPDTDRDHPEAAMNRIWPEEPGFVRQPEE